VRNTGSAVASAQPTVSPARSSWVKSSASGAIVIGVFTRLLALSSRWGLVELYEPRGRVAFDHLIRAVEKSPSAAKRIRLLRAISDTRPNGGFPASTSACGRQAWCQNQLFRRAEGSGYLSHNIRLVRLRTMTDHSPLATLAALFAHLAEERQLTVGQY
jgi:hypothetical protein